MSLRSAQWQCRQAVEAEIHKTRSFGGRRLGFVSDEERAEAAAMERRLLELARRAIRRAA